MELPMPNLPSGALSSPLIVTIETIQAEHSYLTQERLQQIPDNQLLLFWTESATFSISSPVEEENTWYTGSRFFRCKILDQSGCGVGQTDLCIPSDAGDALCALGHGVFDFVLLARNATQVAAAEKLVLLVVRKDGILYRVTAATILETAWIAAKPRRELVVLG